MNLLRLLFGWIPALIAKVPGVHSPHSHIECVMGTVIGLVHDKPGEVNEDSIGRILLPSGHVAVYIVDGAGGEANGAAASSRIASKLELLLREQLESVTDRLALHSLAHEAKGVAEDAAFEAEGKATLLLFILIPNGLWALVHIGDPVFLAQTRDGQWLMPFPPTKVRAARNVTDLLGAPGSSANVHIGTEAIELFLLCSDWVCGNEQNCLFPDQQPQAVLGRYDRPNFKLIDWLLGVLCPQGAMASDAAVVDFLRKTQSPGAVPQIACSRDDLSLIFGRVKQ